MPSLRYVICDVFTERPLTGNPLAVFTRAEGIDDITMQALARELNLSETVFLLAPTNGGQMRLRIFTPQKELPFAGHPVLGAAFVVGSTVQLDVLNLETGVGLIPVRLTREGARLAFGWMSQPVPSRRPFADELALREALGLGRTCGEIAVYDNGMSHGLVEVATRAEMVETRPRFEAVARFDLSTVSVFSEEEGRLGTRVFAPRVGVAEDPATGSAAGPLAFHLAGLGRLPLEQSIEIHQGESLGRPSVISAIVHASAGAPVGVDVGGAAVIVARGEFKL